MLSGNAQEVLNFLAAAGGQATKAEVLKAQTGLSDSDLEGAAMELEIAEYARFTRGGELAGKPLLFVSGSITHTGTASASWLL